MLCDSVCKSGGAIPLAPGAAINKPALNSPWVVEFLSARHSPGERHRPGPGRSTPSSCPPREGCPGSHHPTSTALPSRDRSSFACSPCIRALWAPSAPGAAGQEQRCGHRGSKRCSRAQRDPWERSAGGSHRNGDALVKNPGFKHFIAGRGWGCRAAQLLTLWRRRRALRRCSAAPGSPRATRGTPSTCGPAAAPGKQQTQSAPTNTPSPTTPRLRPPTPGGEPQWAPGPLREQSGPAQPPERGPEWPGPTSSRDAAGRKHREPSR